MAFVKLYSVEVIFVLVLNRDVQRAIVWSNSADRYQPCALTRIVSDFLQPDCSLSHPILCFIRLETEARPLSLELFSCPTFC